jgi:pilus assembly protein Flp/PilA
MYLVPMLRWIETMLPSQGVLRDRRAVTSIEYVIIAIIIATAILGGLSRVGGYLSADLNNVSTEL